MAFFDRHDRLCIVGITPKFVFPRLPVGLHQIGALLVVNFK